MCEPNAERGRPVAGFAARHFALGLCSLLYCFSLGGCDSPHPPPPPAPPPVTAVEPPEPWSITYEDLDIGLKPDQEYAPWMMTVNVERMLGKRVRIEGFISAGGIFQKTGLREFPLVKEQDCPFGKGHAHHVIQVLMREKESVDYTGEPIRFEGRLRLNPVAGPVGSTISLYRLDEATVAP